GGALLAALSLRTEAALIDPGLDRADHGFFGRNAPEAEPPSGAEAETEILPTRPDLDEPAQPGAAPPGADPPESSESSSGSPERP
ncbi:MAG TPA: DUF3068 domain-containing protein, partial [Mycobacterium sp.]|nr:DUF3068 domain-containing protein [Mycobacterium sp.]